MTREASALQQDSETGKWAWLALAIVAVASLAAGWQRPAAASPQASMQYSGMYSFLRDGEFVQITVDDTGALSGFVARYGDLESDKGVLLDHFFKKARLEGNSLSFTTEVVHGISFEFAGALTRGADKKLGEEGYYVIDGKLKETMSDDSGKATSRERGLTLKSLARRSVANGSATQ